jgi:hypothetical protein
MNVDPHLTTTMSRIDDSIAWYSRRARGSRQRYTIASTLQIVLSAAIIVVAAADLRLWGFALPAVLAAVLTIVKGVEATWQWQSKWANYRATAEALKREKYLHAASAGPYALERGATALLAERVEEIISRENLDWVVRVRSTSQSGEALQSKLGAAFPPDKIAT